MEIDCGINCFSTELNGSLRVNHQCPGCVSDFTDHSFGNTILLVAIWMARLVCSTVGCEDILESDIVVFSLSIIAPESQAVISHWVSLGLIWLVGRGAGFGLLNSEQPYRCVPRVVIDEYYTELIVSQGRCGEGCIYIQRYTLKRLCCKLDWHSNDPLLVLGVDADCAHWIVLPTVPDHHLGSGSGSKPNRCKIAGPGCQWTQTVKSGTVWLYTPDMSQ